jgi:hypothetical protein
MSMDAHINKINKDKKARQAKVWEDRVRQAGIN